MVVPAVLIAMKTISFAARSTKPKGGTDLVDVKRLLLAIPEMKTETGEVSAALAELGAAPAALRAWHDVVASTIEPDEDE